ncbi:hypothetical protein Pure04_19200 [Paenarthrobacter ureafaciens]|nr:hypothetical protein Pure04_19200 [Paenarthrobacter ureafaciens]
MVFFDLLRLEMCLAVQFDDQAILDQAVNFTHAGDIHMHLNLKAGPCEVCVGQHFQKRVRPWQNQIHYGPQPSVPIARQFAPKKVRAQKCLADSSLHHDQGFELRPAPQCMEQYIGNSSHRQIGMIRMDALAVVNYAAPGQPPAAAEMQVRHIMQGPEPVEAGRRDARQLPVGTERSHNVRIGALGHVHTAVQSGDPAGSDCLGQGSTAKASDVQGFGSRNPMSAAEKIDDVHMAMVRSAEGASRAQSGLCG